MKNLTQVFFVLVILHSCGPSSPDASKALATQQSSDQKIIPTITTRHRASKGAIDQYIANWQGSRRITAAQAEMKLNTFKEWADLADDGVANGKIDFKKANYGYLFSFDELYEYVVSIKAANDTVSDPQKRIDGIRVYLGASYVQDGYIPEAFLYPTIKFKNIDPIDSDYNKFLERKGNKSIAEIIEEVNQTPGTRPGLNATLPCPETCPPSND